MIRPIHNGVTYPYRFLLILVFSIQPVVGAFEGAHFFRVFLPQPDGLAPPAWNNPALLSRESYWLAAGRGQPLDYEWATYHTLSIGSSWKGNNLSGSLWTSGDSLYRETASGLTVSKSFNPTMRAGLSLTWNRVSISGEDKPQQEISLGAALDREIHPGMAASIWYSGITLAPHLAPTLTRPIVQLCLHSTGEQNLDWAFYVEKTAGYPLEG
ncbi:MAG: hypothetical protein KAU50_04635, partial [Candidatus Marinimicrobia bacterium]|nr:hypothetical protein [Candidatus Neomarinimicrobiota bacterium]